MFINFWFSLQGRAVATNERPARPFGQAERIPIWDMLGLPDAKAFMTASGQRQRSTHVRSRSGLPPL